MSIIQQMISVNIYIIHSSVYNSLTAWSYKYNIKWVQILSFSKIKAALTAQSRYGNALSQISVIILQQMKSRKYAQQHSGSVPAMFCHNHVWAETVQQFAPVQVDQCGPIHLSTAGHWSTMDAAGVHTAHKNTSMSLTSYRIIIHHIIFVM